MRGLGGVLVCCAGRFGWLLCLFLVFGFVGFVCVVESMVCDVLTGFLVVCCRCWLFCRCGVVLLFF